MPSPSRVAAALGALAAGAAPALAAVPEPAVVGTAAIRPAFATPWAAIGNFSAPDEKISDLVAYPGRLYQLPSGEVFLSGKYGWRFRGPSIAGLAPDGWNSDTGKEESVWLGYTEDGGVVAEGSYGRALFGLDAHLRLRWSHGQTPRYPARPLVVTPGNRAFAFGGTPGIIDTTTGMTVAALELPAGHGLPAAAATPDGGAVAVTLPSPLPPASTAAPTLTRFRTDGSRAWAVNLDGGSGVGYASVDGVAVQQNGTTYVVLSRSNGISNWAGSLVAITRDGAVRWQRSIPRTSQPPVFDASGHVWTASGDGIVRVWDAASGRVTFQIRVARASRDTAVQLEADGDAVWVHGETTVRLAARPAPARPQEPGIRVARRIALRQQPIRCLAPPSGRPRTCLYRVPQELAVQVVSPVSGEAQVSVVPARPVYNRIGGRRYRVKAAQDTVHVVRGRNALNPTGWATTCSPRRGCSPVVGRYLVTVTLPPGAVPRTLRGSLMVTGVHGSGVVGPVVLAQ